MNNAIFAACGALALAGTMTLAAQTPTQTPPTRPQPPAPMETGQKPDQRTMTLTGCLKPWDGSMGTASSDPMAKRGSTVTGARYVLAEVEMDRPMGAPTTAAPTSTPAGAASPSHAMATQYIVTAGSGVDLAAHVNHKVRVTGTVGGTHAGMPGMSPADKPIAKPVDVPATRPGDAPKTGKPMGMDHAGTDKGWATFNVSSVAMISATCAATR